MCFFGNKIYFVNANETNEKNKQRVQTTTMRVEKIRIKPKEEKIQQ